jgi:hypothetical protein
MKHGVEGGREGSHIVKLHSRDHDNFYCDDSTTIKASTVLSNIVHVKTFIA